MHVRSLLSGHGYDHKSRTIVFLGRNVAKHELGFVLQ